MTAWVADALKKLTVDEFTRAISKAGQLYGTGCKITSVHRPESGPVKVTVQLAGSNAKKIVTV